MLQGGIFPTPPHIHLSITKPLQTFTDADNYVVSFPVGISMHDKVCGHLFVFFIRFIVAVPIIIVELIVTQLLQIHHYQRTNSCPAGPAHGCHPQH